MKDFIYILLFLGVVGGFLWYYRNRVMPAGQPAVQTQVPAAAVPDFKASIGNMVKKVSDVSVNISWLNKTAPSSAAVSTVVPKTAAQLFAGLTTLAQLILNTPLTNKTYEATFISSGSVQTSKLLQNYPAAQIIAAVSAVSAYFAQLDNEKNAELVKEHNPYIQKYIDTCVLSKGVITINMIIEVEPVWEKQAVLLAHMAAAHTESVTNPTGTSSEISTISDIQSSAKALIS